MLSVIIRSEEEETAWEGKADSVSSCNSQGEFDILPKHANFVTIIKNKPIEIQKKGVLEKIIQPALAVLSVREDVVTIYTVSDTL